jgi:hypothetical protein
VTTFGSGPRTRVRQLTPLRSESKSIRQAFSNNACTSFDALLMNVLSYPGVPKDMVVQGL